MGQGTRERRVDMVLRAVEPFLGSDAASALAVDLSRYLAPQLDRSPGYFVTVANLAVAARASGGPEPTRAAAFLYHHVLRGLWTLASDSGSGDDLRIAYIAYRCAVNSAGLIMLSAQSAEDSGSWAGVLRNLVDIAAAGAPALPAVPELARRVSAGLGLGTGANPNSDLDLDAIDALTVLGVAGAVPLAWDTSPASLARLEASSAVAQLMSDDSQPAPGRFFNAGVTLMVASSPTPPADARTRCVVNGIGLWWSLRLGDDLLSGLTTYDGLDCAVNLVSAAVQLQGDDPEAWEKVQALVGQLVGLSAWAPLRESADRARNVDLGRLAAAARRGVKAADAFDSGTVRAALEEAIDGLAPTPETSFRRLSGDLHTEEAIATTAVLVGAVLGGAWPLAGEIRRLATGRRSPAAVLYDRYKAYVGPTDGPYGNGPFVPLLMSSEEWRATGARVLEHLDSIEDSLRSFVASRPWKVASRWRPADEVGRDLCYYLRRRNPPSRPREGVGA